MRLRQLDLSLFGHFTDKLLDFGPAPAEGSDFHVIYGPNEAGKTTTMEGYLRLLYGFDHKERYAFKHARANLRVGGVVEIGETCHRLTRLPKRGANLVDAHGQAVPDAVLQSVLGGLDIAKYRNLLCLDDATIEAGGEEITNSKGDIGRLLFSAAAGVSDLSTVLEEVEERAAQIYRKGGTKSEFAGLKRDYDEVVQQIKAHDISAAAYRGLRGALEDARKLEADLRAEKAALTLDAVRLTRLSEAHRLARKLAMTQAQLDPLAQYPDKVALDQDDLLDMMKQRVALEGERDRTTAQLEKLARAQAALTPVAEDLAMGQQLEALGPLKSKVEAAQFDLPKRRIEAEQAQADLRAQLTSIGIAPQDPADQQVISEVALAVLEQARDRLADTRKTLQTARAEAQAADEKHRAAAFDVAEAEAQVTIGPQIEAVLLRSDAEDLVARTGQARQEIAGAREAYAADLRKLTRQGVHFKAAPVLPVTVAQARAFGAEVEAARVTLKTTAQAEAAARQTMDRAQTEARLAAEVPDLISDHAATHTRAVRDGLWRAHRAQLDTATAEAFEKAMHADDAQTLIRHTQSHELAAQRQTARHLTQTQADHETASRQYKEAQAASDALAGALRARLRNTGLPDTLAPEDWALWVQQAEEAAAAWDLLEGLEERNADVMDRAQRLESDLAEVLEAEGTVPMSGASLGALMKQAARLLAERDAQQHEVRLAQAAARTAKAEADRRAAALAEAQEAHEAALTGWRAAVATHLPGLTQDADGWDGLAGLRRIREIHATKLRLDRQISGMEQDMAAFNGALDALAPEGAEDQDLIDRYRQLLARAEAARQTQTTFEDIAAERETLETARAEAESALGVLEGQARSMAAWFEDTIPTATLEDLRRAAQGAAEAATLRETVRQTRHEIYALLDLTAWDQVTETLAATPAERAEAEQQTTAQETERVGAALEQAIAARSAARVSLDRVAGGDEIAVLGSRKRTLEAQMEAALLRYMEERLSWRLADQAIRRYRDSHRSGMLAATEAAFRDLTGGAYTSLTTQPGAGGDVLVAMQASDQMAKQAVDMSKGTRFQLYLALRAAAYAQMAQSGTVLPFFCDDVFETFDETRTRAACTLMQRVGQTGQSIYLTHHRHVVDIAREVCGDRMTLHRL